MLHACVVAECTLARHTAQACVPQEPEGELPALPAPPSAAAADEGKEVAGSVMQRGARARPLWRRLLAAACCARKAGLSLLPQARLPSLHWSPSDAHALHQRCDLVGHRIMQPFFP